MTEPKSKLRQAMKSTSQARQDVIERIAREVADRELGAAAALEIERSLARMEGYRSGLLAAMQLLDESVENGEEPASLIRAEIDRVSLK